MSTSSILYPTDSAEDQSSDQPNHDTPEAADVGISADQFQALEQKIVRAVEIVRRERELRAAAEAEAQSLREQIDALMGATNEAQTQIIALNQERDVVRTRVEKLLFQMDELL